MLLIFLLSHQDRDASARTSEWVLMILEWLRIDLEALQGYNLRFYIRKLAHLTIYFVLFWFSIRFFLSQYPRSQAMKISLVFCVFYACTDEIHQLFIPGRVGTIIDVGIDSLGAVLGLLSWNLWQIRRNKIHARRVQKSA